MWFVKGGRTNALAVLSRRWETVAKNRGTLPMTILPSDTHIHTPLCKHARGEPAEYAASAQRRRVGEIIFCDHAPAPDGYDPVSRMSLAQFGEYAQAIRDLRDACDGLSIGLGIEADYYPGCADFLENWLPAQEFDMVIGSVHAIDGWGFDDPAYIAGWSSVNVKEVWRRYFELICELAETGMYDVVAHLDLPKKFGHRISDADLREIAWPALDRIAAAGMAIELNTGGLRKPVKEIYPSGYLLSLIRQHNIPICFGSDAHAPEEVAHAFEDAVALAEQAGYNGYVRFGGRRKTFVAFSGS
jgi:histidinol-phosphatase (PHP family)